METKKYTVLVGTHYHGGKCYKQGDEVPLTEKQFKMFANKFELSDGKKAKASKTDGEVSEDFNDYKVDELKEMLEVLEIDIPEGSKKADLVALLEANNKD